MPQGRAYRVALWIVSIQCCALFSLFASSQTSPNYGSSSSGATVALSGTVLNSVTSEPIRHAVVRVFDGAERSALTDENGHFQVDNLPPGQATVTARKPGFLDQVPDESPPTVTTISSDAPPLIVKLIPQGVIYGQIQNTDREPIEALPVKAIVSLIVDGRKVWQEAGQTSTNEDGEFRIANLAPGTYYLAAGPSTGNRESSADEVYPAMFYPGVPDTTSAATVHVEPGQQLNADFALTSVPAFKVAGRLAGLATSWAPNFMFVDRLGNRFSFLKRFDPHSGQFEAEVPAGQYTLQATNWTDGKVTQAQTELNVTSNIAGVVLTLGTSEPTPVIVKTENMRLSSGALRSGQDGRNLVRVHFIENGESISNSEYWSELRSDTSPSLAMPEVPPGTYTVEVFASGSWYVRSAQSGATDLLREPLTVSAGSQIQPIEVTLRNDGPTLTGRVALDPGGRPTTVIALPEPGSSAQAVSATTGSDGSFSLSNLAPGNYSVLAVNRADKLEYANPAAMGQFLPRAAHVTLQPNGQRQISLDLINVAN